MDFNPVAVSALVSAALLLLTLFMLRRRQREVPRRPARLDELDTVIDWPPESVRVLTVAERQAYDLLRKSLPGFMVLAQVPLARFVKVPSRHSYVEWMQRVGSLSADLLLCDSGSRVLAVVDIRSANESERSRRRHERMARVLKAAGIKVYTWREGELPSATQVRALLGGDFSEKAPKPTGSRPTPLIPVAEMEEILAEGDAANHDGALEPVPSAFFDDMTPTPAPSTARR
jgi:hypothetical protein